MRMLDRMAASKINILCGYLQNCSFIRRVPPYYQFFWANFDDFQKMAAMFLVILIYQIIHDSAPQNLIFEAAMLANILIYQIILDSG